MLRASWRLVCGQEPTLVCGLWGTAGGPAGCRRPFSLGASLWGTNLERLQAWELSARAAVASGL